MSSSDLPMNDRSARKGPADEDPARRRDQRAARRSESLRLADHPDWLRLSDALRRQVAACVELDIAPEEMARLADRAEAEADELEAHAHGKRYRLVEDAWQSAAGAMDYLPFSPVMGRLNPGSLGVRIRRETDRVVSELRLAEVVEGGTGLVHGGVIAAIYDEVLAAANLIEQVGGPTGRLTVRYKKPTPLYEMLRFEAWVDRIEGRKVYTRGHCLVGDVVVSEADALFVLFKLDPNATDWHKRSESER